MRREQPRSVDFSVVLEAFASGALQAVPDALKATPACSSPSSSPSRSIPVEDPMPSSLSISKPFAISLGSLLLLAGGALGWVGHLAYARPHGSFMRALGPTVTMRGVTLTPEMQDEIRIFHTACHSSMDLANPAMYDENDKFADECVARAVDRYKLNPRAPFSAFLIDQIAMVNALAGSPPPTPEEIDAVHQLRAYSRSGL